MNKGWVKQAGINLKAYFYQIYCVHHLWMSNLANYSPYNKTFKFLLFQNQAYHEKNKREAKPHVRTNLRYQKLSSSFQSENPEQNSMLFSSQGKPSTRSTQRGESADASVMQSMLRSSQLGKSQPVIDKPKRVVHKNQSFEKFRQRKINSENKDLVKRLIHTSCEVIRNKNSAESYRKHLKYKQIRNKFDEEGGQRKHILALGKSELLCPTLKNFNESQAGSEFLEMDMSWISASKNNSLRTSIRKRHSNFC